MSNDTSAPFSASQVRASNVEHTCMPAICFGWDQRAQALALPKKGEKRERDREAYMQGALAALVAAGLIDQSRAGQIGFLCAVGRLEQYMTEHAKRYVAPV